MMLKKNQLKTFSNYSHDITKTKKPQINKL